MMSHDAPLVAVILGILKAGAIVVALDPLDPVSRHKVIVDDAEPCIVVTDAQHRDLAAECGLADGSILDFDSETAMGLAQNLSVEVQPGQTAFLTYTSGTTGRPKGVMQTHRQFRRSAAACNDALQFRDDDRVPLLSMVSTGFGAGTGLWGALLNGVRICPFSPKTRSIAALADWIIDSGLTVYVSSASLFRTLAKTIDDRLMFANVRAVMLHGETVTADDFETFRRHFPSTSILIHTLASSETANVAWSRWAPHDKIRAGPLPVGHFAREMDVVLLGDDDRPVARGDIGEIVVRSRYLANGYWRDPALTARRFSEGIDGRGMSMLRTGDRGRINAEGMLEYCGRKDERIRIRGNRIEPLDVELALEALPGIDRAAVAAVARDNHEPLLVAFVVKAGDASWTAPRLRLALRANLPIHMVPSRILFLDSLPTNRSNKIDREALRQYPISVHGRKSDTPRTETETLLAEIWAEALELPGIGRSDDFFGLGGDSLIGAIVGARVHAALGVELTLAAIADHPTISALARFIDRNRRIDVAGTTPIVPVPRAGAMPMSFLQETIWNHWRSRQDRAGLTHVRSYRIRGPLDVEVFKKCLDYLVDRHEILRTTFGLVEARPAQIIHQSAPRCLSFVDLAGVADPEAQADNVFREESSREIDLGKLPIRRNVLVRISPDNYRLLRVSHPIVMDGFGSQILDSELAILYEAILHGKNPPLPKQSPLHYADYAAWQRQFMRPGHPYFNEAVSWWKTLASRVAPAIRQPNEKPTRRAPLDPRAGVLQWCVEEQTAKRLDEIARKAGATHFTIRLAAFAALIGDAIGDAPIVIGTGFANRNRIETQNLVGPLRNPVCLLFAYDPNKTFLEWLEYVRDQVFDATTRGELPFETIREHLHVSGVELPDMLFYVTMTRDNSDQHFANLVISGEFWEVGAMPSGCTVFIDEQKPEHCRLNFDANSYDRKEMRAMLDRYIRLLEAVAREPELPIGKLLAIVRWDDALAELLTDDQGAPGI